MNPIRKTIIGIAALAAIAALDAGALATGHFAADEAPILSISRNTGATTLDYNMWCPICRSGHGCPAHMKKKAG